MFLTSSGMGTGEAAVTALLGYAVVFVGLVLLMLVVMVLGKAMQKSAKKKPEETPAAAPAVSAEEATGSAGELKLHDVSPRDAAMIMAIVAEKTGKPLNKLRFKSIREVKCDEV